MPETSTINGDDKSGADGEPIEPSAEASGAVAVVTLEEPDARKEHGAAVVGGTLSSAVPGDAALRPAVSPEVRADAVPESPVLAPAAASQKAPTPAFITFNCPGCGRKVGFPAQVPGTPASCPACHLAIMIPDKSGGESFVIGSVAPSPEASPLPKAQPARQGDAPRHAPPSGHAVKLPTPPHVRPARVHGQDAHATENGPDAHAVNGPAAKRSSRRRRAAVWATFIVGVALLVAIAVGGPRLRRWLTELSASRASATARPETKVARAAILPDCGSNNPGGLLHTPEPPAERPAPPKETVPKPVQSPAPPADAPDAGAVDPVEPLEIRPAAIEAKADLDVLLTMNEKRNNHRDDDDEEPAAKAKKAPVAPRPAGGGIEKAIDRLANPEADLKVAEVSQRQAARPAAKVPPAPLPCEKCMGTRFLPLASFTPYVQLEKDAWPNPAAAVPWQYCPHCQGGKDNAALVQAEGERLKTALEQHKKWQEQTRQTLLYAETRHVAIHAQLQEGSLRRVAAMLETLTAHLEQLTLTTVMTQTRPNTHELVIYSDVQAYGTYHSGAGRRSDQDERHKQVFVVSQKLQRPPEHMALFKLGRMLIAEATDGKAPAWLTEGFAAYCENAVTHRNLCYPQTAPGDEFKYGENWDTALKRLAAQNKLPVLERFFPLSRTNMSVADYMASYSLVGCLLKSNPRNFARFVLEVRGGTPAGDALERVYGRNPKDTQVAWAQWVQSR